MLREAEASGQSQQMSLRKVYLSTSSFSTLPANADALDRERSGEKDGDGTHPAVSRHRDEQDRVDDGKEAGQAVGLDGRADDALDDRERVLVVIGGGSAKVVNAAAASGEFVSKVRSEGTKGC